MEEKSFVFTSELTKKLVKLRFENDWLFKERKQPYKDFHKILMEHGFPEEMQVRHVRKRWSYLYETYKIAKKERNTSWKYYKLFEKHYGKTKILDKYESWNDEWRLKLITCIIEAKEHKVDFKNMWLTVEKAMRCQDLPANCCIQDIKGLWHHIKTTFGRKHRMKMRSYLCEWALYSRMLDYYQRFEPGGLLAIELPGKKGQPRKSSLLYCNRNQPDVDEYDFQWTKDITETFIQIRLQHDWLFRERKWAWNDLLAIMQDEYGFPKELTGREICRKWAATFSDYQKAIATNNKSWTYYTIFELYLGEGSLSLNPLVGWQEEWVFNLISARLDLNHLFHVPNKAHNEGWREVEKRLRSIGLPLDHSLLELPQIWTHLEKTYRWKKKFAKKGILTEQWPYFEAMAQYESIKPQFTPTLIKKQKQEPNYDSYDCVDNDDDYEDDIKLFDLKQRLGKEVKPKIEYLEANQCRSCSSDEGCVNIYQQKDDEGLTLADKLRMIGDIKLDPTDNLPSQICLNCLRDLENAYKFRRKCQRVDHELRNLNSAPHNVKVEVLIDEFPNQNVANPKQELNCNDADKTDIEDFDNHFDDYEPSDKEIKRKIKKEPVKIPKKKKRVKKEKYEYFKICDICGKYTKNLKNHLDAHATEKCYTCDVCDKKFKFKSGLVIHKAVHDATPKKTCEICGKTFHIMAQYRRHFVYHANERKFECETCGKRFNTTDILKVHARTHTDERPFSCPICGKTFRTAGCVSRHKRIVHRTAKC